MKKILQLIIEERKKVKKKPPFLVSLSGGQDSILTFLILLHGFDPKFFEVLYCHHFWQPKNFFSVNLIFKLSFLFKISYTVIVPSKSLVTENLSRRWRRNNFSRLGYFLKTQTLIGGQTKTDISEKNISKILRGTTPYGLTENGLLDFEPTRSAFFSICNHKIFFLEKNISASLVFFGIKKFTRGYLLFSFSKISFFYQIKKRSFIRFKKKNKVKNFQFFTRQQLDKKIISKKKIFTKVEKDSLQQYIFCSKFESITQQKTKNKFSISCYVYSKFRNIPTTRWNPSETINRYSISKIVNFYKFPIVQDTTNFSNNFLRNKIRQNLVPYLRLNFNSGFEIRLEKFLYKVDSNKAQIKKKILTILLCLKISDFFNKLRIQELPNFCEAEEKFAESKPIQKTKSQSFQTKFFRPKLVLATIETPEIESVLIQKLFLSYKNLDLNSVQNEFLQNSLVKNRLT